MTDADRIAQLKREVAKLRGELNETWVDDFGTVWTRPTAWAYAMVCKACDKHQAENATLRGTVEGLRGALEKCFAALTVYVTGGNPNSPYIDGMHPLYVMGSKEALDTAQAALGAGEQGRGE